MLYPFLYSNIICAVSQLKTKVRWISVFEDFFPANTANRNLANLQINEFIFHINFINDSDLTEVLHAHVNLPFYL